MSEKVNSKRVNDLFGHVKEFENYPETSGFRTINNKVEKKTTQ